MRKGSTFSDAARILAGIVPRTLGWMPDNFWNSTPAELATIFDADAGHLASQAMSRAELTDLMERERNG